MFKKSRFKSFFVILVAMFFTLSLFSNIVEAKPAATSNKPPAIQQCSSTTIATDEDQTSQPLTLNATDTNGDTLTWSVSTAPTKGTANISIISSSAGNSVAGVTYKPKENLNGSDKFVLKVIDGKGGTASITVNVTINPVNDSPVNTVAPGISGTTAVGSTLTATTETWTDDSQVPLAFSYQWQEAADSQGTNLTNLTYAIGSTYALVSTDTGKYIRVAVTASDGSLNSTAYSEWLLIPVKTINYVSLGDSIATGTIYPGKVITTYVANFYQYLQQQNPAAQVNLQKLATDGYRTNDLYAKLGLATGSIDPSYESAIKSASIITMSIGGNNLMQAAKDSSSYSGYNFNYINDTIAQQGVSDFNTQWAPIINKIRELAPTAQIIVTTVYNPYNLSDTKLHDQVDSYLFRTDGRGINNVINNSTSLGYSVADVFTAFDAKSDGNMGTITYFYPSPWDIMGTLTRNLHPNAAGQDIITKLHIAAYKPIN